MSEHDKPQKVDGTIEVKVPSTLPSPFWSNSPNPPENIGTISATVRIYGAAEAQVSFVTTYGLLANANAYDVRVSLRSRQAILTPDHPEIRKTNGGADFRNLYPNSNWPTGSAKRIQDAAIGAYYQALDAHPGIIREAEVAKADRLVARLLNEEEEADLHFRDILKNREAAQEARKALDTPHG